MGTTGSRDVWTTSSTSAGIVSVGDLVAVWTVCSICSCRVYRSQCLGDVACAATDVQAIRVACHTVLALPCAHMYHTSNMCHSYISTGTAEVESALVEHPACAEAAVVGVEHPIKGQGIYAYCTLMEGTPYTAKLQKELVQQVREQIGAFAAPDVIHWAPALPKTRSGKIMRRVLRKIATREVR